MFNLRDEFVVVQVYLTRFAASQDSSWLFWILDTHCHQCFFAAFLIGKRCAESARVNASSYFGKICENTKKASIILHIKASLASSIKSSLQLYFTQFKDSPWSFSLYSPASDTRLWQICSECRRTWPCRPQTCGLLVRSSRFYCLVIRTTGAGVFWRRSQWEKGSQLMKWMRPVKSYKKDAKRVNRREWAKMG